MNKIIKNKDIRLTFKFFVIILIIFLSFGPIKDLEAQTNPQPYIDTTGDFGPANWNSSPDFSTFQGGNSNSNSNIPKAIGVDEELAGPSNATANTSNIGDTSLQSQNQKAVNSARNVSGCIASSLLTKLLASSINSAISKAKNVAMDAKEMITRIPATLGGTELAKTQEAEISARTGTFIFGTQVGISWDSIAYCIVNTIIDYVVNSTIQWANSGFKGNPAFVRNPEQFFKQLADREAANFIQELAYNTTGINVCQPFRVVVSTGLRGSYAGMNNYARYNSCSLSQMQQVAMQSGKYTITTPTDWIALTMPQNNVYYSYIRAGEELNKRINVKRNTATLDLTLNRGFLSYKKCKDNTKPESKTNPCDTVTPGGFIADSLSSTLNIPKERLVSAQKFDQMVDAIVNNLIKIALNKVLEDVTGKEASRARTSDYYSTVVNDYPYPNNDPYTQTNPYRPVGQQGTVGTGGSMMQDILNGATFANPDWNNYALQQIVAVGLPNIPVRDAAVFFPDGIPTAQGYLSIMAAIAKRESGGLAKPKRYLETEIGAGNTYSVGLMSLTPGDYGTAGLTYDDLEDPYINIRVAVGIMGKLLRKDGVISGPPSRSTPAGTGLSAYWSTFKYNN